MAALQVPVAFVEYGDFECPNCKQAAPAVKLLFERYAGKVRLVYRLSPRHGGRADGTVHSGSCDPAHASERQR